MNIAVAVYKPSETSEISTQTGRAPFFLVFEETLVETLKNPFSVGGGGAGFGVAKMLADKQVKAVAAGKFGSKMIDALQERGIQAYEVQGTVKEALDRIQETQKK
jgi:predicted Fe-Mo cluster-binding NifX family protein